MKRIPQILYYTFLTGIILFNTSFAQNNDVCTCPCDCDSTNNEEPVPEPVGPFPEILINEVSFKNSEKDWVELYVIDDNGGTLKGLSLYDDGEVFTIQDEISVNSDTYIYVSFKNDVFSANSKDIYAAQSGLTGTTEQIYLTNNKEEIVDMVCWQNNEPTSGEITDFKELSTEWNGTIDNCLDSTEVSNTSSIARKNFSDTNSINDWEIHPHPTPNERNEQTNEDPVAVITVQSGETTGIGKVTINLDGNESYDPDDDEITYLWNFDDGETSENNNPPSHTYTETGEYTLSLTVTDEFGAENEATLLITVREDEEIPVEDPPASNGSLNSEIAITEIFPNPEGADGGLEWIEIYNPTESDTNLSNWKIVKDDKNEFIFKDKLLEAGKYLTISDEELKFSLKNSESKLDLIDFENTVINSVTYTDVKENNSYTKTNLNNTSNDTTEEIWQWIENISPGSENPEYLIYEGEVLEILEGLMTLQLENENLIVDLGDFNNDPLLIDTLLNKIVRITVENNEPLLLKEIEITGDAIIEEKSEEPQSLITYVYLTLSTLPPIGIGGYIGFKKFLA